MEIPNANILWIYIFLCLIKMTAEIEQGKLPYKLSMLDHFNKFKEVPKNQPWDYNTQNYKDWTFVQDREILIQIGKFLFFDRYYLSVKILVPNVCLFVPCLEGNVVVKNCQEIALGKSRQASCRAPGGCPALVTHLGSVGEFFNNIDAQVLPWSVKSESLAWVFLKALCFVLKPPLRITG